MNVLFRRVQTERDRREYNRFRCFYRAAWSFWTIRFIRTSRVWEKRRRACPLIFEPILLNPLYPAKGANAMQVLTDANIS